MPFCQIWIRGSIEPMVVKSSGVAHLSLIKGSGNLADPTVVNCVPKTRYEGKKTRSVLQINQKVSEFSFLKNWKVTLCDSEAAFRFWKL